MNAFSDEEKNLLCPKLKEMGFEFYKIKVRKPGVGIVDNRLATRILDSERFGNSVICVNLDAENDPWSLAPSWEIALDDTTLTFEFPDKEPVTISKEQFDKLPEQLEDKAFREERKARSKKTDRNGE